MCKRTAPLNIRLVHPADLDPAQLAAWSGLQRAGDSLDSAFFSPKFTQAVAAARDDVEVAVMEQEGELIGFFPFHRLPRNVGQPVGMRLSDLHGAIVRDDVVWNAKDLIVGCGLAVWHFRHLPPSQHPLRAFQRTAVDSPYIDLPDGCEAYEAGRRRAGSSLIPQIRRKSRKIEREVGPLRFEWHTADREVFERLLAWKSDQRRRTRTFDALQSGWVVELLDHIRLCQSNGFAGVFSALYVGDEIAAIHLGMRSERVFHFWFPTYNRAYVKYSPGLILLLELIRECAARGIVRIDLGRGRERYKTSMMSGVMGLAEGCVAARPIVGAVQGAWYRARALARTKPLRGPVAFSKRMVRRLRRWP